MARRINLRLISAPLLVLGLALAPAAVVHAQEGTPGGCGTPAVPAVPADPGAPGGGATPAQPAQPAQPAKCPEGGTVSGASVKGAGVSGSGAGAAQAGPDGILGTADDILPTSASTGFGGAADGQSTDSALLLTAAGLALMASLGVRRLARARS